MKNLNEINKLIDELTEKLENLNDKTNLNELEKDLEPLKKELKDNLDNTE